MYYWRNQRGYFLALVLMLSLYFTVRIVCSYKGIFIDQHFELILTLLATMLLIRLIFSPKR